MHFPKGPHRSNRRGRFFCALPFVHQIIHADGKARLCCTSGTGPPLTTANGDTQDYAHSMWNHPFNRNARQKIAAGEIPEACLTCVQGEKGGYSRRLRESAKFLGLRSWRSLLSKLGPDGTMPYEVSALELRSDRTCPGQCVMCGPEHSTAWEKLVPRLKTEADYVLPAGHVTPPRIEELQSYADVIQRHPTITFVRFAGGEPFLSRQHLPALKALRQKQNVNDISLEYLTSGYGFQSAFVGYWRFFRNVTVLLSLDGPERLNDFIRYPLRFRKALKICDTILSTTGANVAVKIQITIQLLNIEHLHELAQEREVRRLVSRHAPRLSFGFHFLHDPQALSISSLPPERREVAIRRLHNVAPYIRAHQRSDDRGVEEIIRQLKATPYNEAGLSEARDYVSWVSGARKETRWVPQI